MCVHILDLSSDFLLNSVIRIFVPLKLFAFMAVYRFRISFEDHEDVYREIDIMGKQNFEDLHRAIQEAIGFDNMKDAWFYISDDHWRKGREIALRAKATDDDDDDDDWRKPKKPVAIMSKSRIVDFIDDPHQKLLYLYDPEAQWHLFVELIKILTEEPKVNYPRCSKSTGTAPKQYKVVTPPPDVDEDEPEEEGPKKERVFTAEEAYDEEEKTDDEESTTESDSEEEESEGGEEGEEESGGSSFGEEAAEEF